jgi:hypothetical protein
MSYIDEVGLSDQIRVPGLQGIVVSAENRETTMGMPMTLVTSSETGTHLQNLGFYGKLELHKVWEE